MKKIRECPICGRIYSGYPAISRTDNTTEICSICGVRQALDAAGIVGDAADEILLYVADHTAELDSDSDSDANE